MDNISLLLALIGFLLVMGNWGWYLSTIPKGTVPVYPIVSKVLQVDGVIAALVALFFLRFNAPLLDSIALILAVFAIIMGVSFLWLLTQRQIPLGDLQVKVGDPVMPFGALTSAGLWFHSDDLKGKRTLFKFFRGGW